MQCPTFGLYYCQYYNELPYTNGTVKTLTETYVYYLLQKTRKIVFYRLRIHHNNRNKSINFILMWNQANKKKKKISMRPEIQTRDDEG